MTDRTQPEALRLANVCSNLTRYSMDAHLIAAELRRQHARIAELEAVGAGGVQALSAAPEAFLKSVIALCSHRGYSPANIEAWDKDDKWIADLWRQAEAMIAASPTPTPTPTPPAEQQAKLGAVYAELPKRRRQFLCTKCGSRECKVGTINEQHPPCECGYLGFAEDLDFNADEMRDFADRTHAARLRCKSEQARLATLWGYVRADAAPKTAPGEGNSGFDRQTAADLLNNKTVSDEAVRKFVAASRWAHDERAALSATLLAMHGVLTSREAEIAHLKKALLEAEAAPQQEAQEPVAWLNPWRADQVTTDYDAYGEHGIALYTAPQADSVLEDAARLDWLESQSQVNIERVRYLGADTSIYEVTPFNGTDYNGETLRKAIDAARKQGASHDR